MAVFSVLSDMPPAFPCWACFCLLSHVRFSLVLSRAQIQIYGHPSWHLGIGFSLRSLSFLIRTQSFLLLLQTQGSLFIQHLLPHCRPWAVPRERLRVAQKVAPGTLTLLVTWINHQGLFKDLIYVSWSGQIPEEMRYEPRMKDMNRLWGVGEGEHSRSREHGAQRLRDRDSLTLGTEWCPWVRLCSTLENLQTEESL